MPDRTIELRATATRAFADYTDTGADTDDRPVTMSAAPDDEQPLLADDVEGQRAPDADGGDGPGGRSDSPSRFVWMLSFAAGLSGLLFGYDTGVISATLVTIGDTLNGRPLTDLDKSVITSCTALLALVASPMASVLADARGRRLVVVAADVLFVAGALMQAGAQSVAGMVLGRSVMGAAVGAASFVVPLYIAEAAPAAHRGRLVTANVLFITLGAVVAYVGGWLLAAHTDPAVAWRAMVGIGAVPAVLQAVLVCVALPESPRWLVRAGRPAEARAVLARVHGGTGAEAEADVAAILASIAAEVRAEEQASRQRQRLAAATAGATTTTTTTTTTATIIPPKSQHWRMPQWLTSDSDAWAALLGERRNRRALAIACLLQGLQQLCGFNSLMYFSATIFALVGFREPTLTALTVAGTNFVFTVVALLLIDRIGRRRVLLWSVPIMTGALLLAAYGFSFLPWSPVRGSDSSSATDDTGNGAAIILTSILLYVAAYASGLGNVPWMQSELFALEVRSLGSGLATATNWLANFVVGLTFLPLMDALSPSWTFVLYAVVCAGGWLLVRSCYPETSGRSLEAAARLLERDDWGVGAPAPSSAAADGEQERAS